MAFGIQGFQVNLFTDEIEPTVAFYAGLGFAESFRTPTHGPSTHVELRAGGLTIGVASLRIADEELGLGVRPGASSAEVLLWVDDVEGAYVAALEAGGTSVAAPSGAEGRLRHAWVRDPSSHLLELVEERRDSTC
jgi:catechol 2,3-dioxygenase-like lactoylglutathione lyase family enzyme